MIGRQHGCSIRLHDAAQRTFVLTALVTMTSKPATATATAQQQVSAATPKTPKPADGAPKSTRPGRQSNKSASPRARGVRGSTCLDIGQAPFLDPELVASPPSFPSPSGSRQVQSPPPGSRWILTSRLARAQRGLPLAWLGFLWGLLLYPAVVRLLLGSLLLFHCKLVLPFHCCQTGPVALASIVFRTVSLVYTPLLWSVVVDSDFMVLGLDLWSGLGTLWSWI